MVLHEYASIISKIQAGMKLKMVEFCHTAEKDHVCH